MLTTEDAYNIILRYKNTKINIYIRLEGFDYSHL